MFTKACKKLGLKKRRGMNQSASQPKREGRLRCPRHVLQGPHGSHHRTAEKLKPSLLRLSPHRNETIHSCPPFTLTSKAPSSHHSFLALRIQRACIFLLRVNL